MKYCRYDKRNKAKIVSKKRKERNKGKNIINKHNNHKKNNCI